MMKKKTRFDWICIVLALGIVLCLVGFLYYGLALGDPERFNWRRDYLNGEAMDAYLHTGDMVIAVTFFGLILGSMAFLLLDLLLRKKASHIAAVLVACAVSFAYCLAMGIYRFALGSVNVLTGILYALAALGVAASTALFFKKALDGDNLTAYWACFAFATIFLVFGGAGDKSFSILNAYSHNGDFNFWMGYLSSRLVVVLFLIAGYVNQRYDYCPEEKLTSEAK